MAIKERNIDTLDLSMRSRGVLHRHGVHTVGQMLVCTESQLLAMRNLGRRSVDEILLAIEEWREKIRKEDETQGADAGMVADITDYPDVIVRYTKANDVDLMVVLQSNRAKNQLRKCGLTHMSDIVLMTPRQLQNIPAMGRVTVEEVAALIKDYLAEHQENIRRLCMGDETVLIGDETLRKSIRIYITESGIAGRTSEELEQRFVSPEVSLERVKQILDELVSEHELRYTRSRWYRVFGSFADCVARCVFHEERSRRFLQLRLEGNTLDAIAKENGNLTRERARQIIRGALDVVVRWQTERIGTALFDDDRYRYFFETYEFEKEDAPSWFDISLSTIHYLETVCRKSGTKPLQEALEDPQLSISLRRKIDTYLNRNKVLVEGEWIEKKRASLEEAAVKRLCKEDVSFTRFVQMYNAFMEEIGIAFDPQLYITPEVLRTRKNRLADADFLLWKQNEMMRYYDISARDYTELLQTLGFEAYEQMEISTAKWVKDYPDLMKRYDLRDAYELHNLLRKIVPDGAYHDFHCGRMPHVRFGEFDRDKVVLELVIEHAPIEATRLCEILQEEYGFDPLLMRNHLNVVDEYLFQGVYTVDQKAMPEEHQALLKAVLTEDFYFLEEIRDRYVQCVPSADVTLVNGYNLKRMGYTVLSRYVLTRHASLDAFFRDLFTASELTDLEPIRQRYMSVQAFYSVLAALKKERVVVEYDPDRLIVMQRLEQNGVTIACVEQFCDDVWAFVQDDACFTVRSLRTGGFSSELEDLGFSDWFLGGLLATDERFSFGMVYNNYVFRKGDRAISVQSLLLERIVHHGSIDVLDLMTEMSDVYGCCCDDKWHMIPKLQGTTVYHDKFLDRLYKNKQLYYEELDEND